jgi:hypothetical protein
LNLIPKLLLDRLLAIDCWDRAHFKAFDVIDRQSGAMLLLSTRVGGLIGTGASTEVKLTLMSIHESVQMLAHGAGLDSDILSPSLLEVARLCGKCVYVCVCVCVCFCLCVCVSVLTFIILVLNSQAACLSLST